MLQDDAPPPAALNGACVHCCFFVLELAGVREQVMELRAAEAELRKLAGSGRRIELGSRAFEVADRALNPGGLYVQLAL